MGKRGSSKKQRSRAKARKPGTRAKKRKAKNPWVAIEKVLQKLTEKQQRFMQELGIEVRVPGKDEGNGKQVYKDEEDDRSDYNKAFSGRGWDLEKRPVKGAEESEEPYRGEEQFFIWKGIKYAERPDGAPQNIDVHAIRQVVQEVEQRRRQKRRTSKYPCGGRLRGYFQRAHSHYNTPADHGHGEMGIDISSGRRSLSLRH